MTSEPNVLPESRTANIYMRDNQPYSYTEYGSEQYDQRNDQRDGQHDQYDRQYPQYQQYPQEYASAGDVSVESYDSYEANYDTYDQPGLVPHRSILRDIFEIFLLIVTIYTLVNLATARAVVEGQSMQPNFYTGQLVIVNRFAYYFAKPQRGDVIVLHDPKDNNQDFIKRVMGLPGETVELRDGRIYVNGVLMDEPYIEQFCQSCENKSWTMQEDEYFVLGDNRSNSYDSHSFGPINRRVIVGQAWIRYWPLQNFGFIEHPRYAEVPTTPPPPVDETQPEQPAY